MNPFQMRFSAVEVQHLLRAWGAISLAFAILNSRGLHLTAAFAFAVAISAITVGVGFLLHELMHKYFAQKYGCRAEFRAFDFMLLVSLVMSFFGFIFAAPGGVFISGHVNTARSGRISAAGPATNIVLAALFLGVLLAARSLALSPLLLQVAKYGASINAWLGVFNLLPFLGLDGSKVMYWNMKVYGVMLALALGMMVATFVI